MVLPVVLILVGLVFFARALGYVSSDVLNILWPLLAVIVGLSMLSNRWFGHKCDDKTCWRCMEVSFSDKPKKRRS